MDVTDTGKVLNQKVAKSQIVLSLILILILILILVKTFAPP